MIDFCAGVLGSPCFLPAAIGVLVFELATIFVVRRNLRRPVEPGCLRCAPGE
jgi:hypothetical protein